ncbi:MAG: sugar phosphate nucleotidyltransferase [Bacteroidetes bacterium]|nr:sugar phosphate nucleotidyltransferase [Bacteroidota bacterium]
MKAMILAAGLGTRLKPFTEVHPKALYTIHGKTLLEHAVNHLKSSGIHDIIINVHHFAEQIIEFIHLHNYFECSISISDEKGALLETGGGIKKATWFFENCDAAVVRNVDILSDLDLLRMAKSHLNSGSLATLAVRNRETSRYFLFDDQMNLCGWENRKTGERRLSYEADITTAYAFSGMQILDPCIFAMIMEEGNFSLTDLYLRLAKTNEIKGYLEDGILWKDIGKL